MECTMGFLAIDLFLLGFIAGGVVAIAMTIRAIRRERRGPPAGH
jgi:hypothetical protein